MESHRKTGVDLALCAHTDRKGNFKSLNEAELSFKEKELLKLMLHKIKGTDVKLLLKESGFIRK